MKFLIIGLGNPGINYENTRHNIGFKVLDKFVSKFKIKFQSEKYADVCEISLKGRKLILLKPNTFMNLSGKAVKYWMDKTKVRRENLLVVTDDISLVFGSLRLRKKGSDGGHNGLKNIQESLGSNIFSRLRFGVGNDFLKGGQSDYVLGSFTHEDLQKIDERIDLTIKIIESFSTIGVERTMSDFNGK